MTEIKDKITMELLIKQYTTAEGTAAASDLKHELIMTLINSKVPYINVISYYYDILNAQNK